jgi:HD-GYP domain-containing protein (c-di-GMP phosphodiesterase class II)
MHHRPTLGHDDALEELREGAGAKSSAEIVDIFLQGVGGLDGGRISRQ